MAKCNKCNREGLSWGKKTLKDGKVINILVEADGSDHRPYKDGEAKCNPTVPEQILDPNQQKLPTPKPELKVNLNDITDPKTIEKARNIWKLFRVNAIQLAISENIGSMFNPCTQPFTKTQEEEIHKIFLALLEISRSRLM